MKPARLLVLAVAGLAAGAAAMLMMQSPPAPETVIVERKTPSKSTDVLIAAGDLPIGQTLRGADIRWQPWPIDLVPPGAITRTEGQNAALAEFEGSIVRQGLLTGEPIRREKLVKANSNAFMSAILPAGMRAYAIAIDTRGSSSAGGFILPHDRVDVLRTFREDGASKGGGRTFKAPRPSCRTSGCWRSARTSRIATARRSSPARPRRSRSPSTRPRSSRSASGPGSSRSCCAASPMRA